MIAQLAGSSGVQASYYLRYGALRWPRVNRIYLGKG